MKIKQNKLYIFGLAILFALPGILAYFFYTHSYLLSSQTTNHGQLLQLPILLAEKSAKQKWRIIYWQRNNCDASCMNMLNKLAHIRIFLGRKLYQTELVFLTPEKLSTAQIMSLKENDILVSNNLSADDVKWISNEPKIFLQDTKGYLILKYPTSINGKDLLHDLKHLLNQEN